MPIISIAVDGPGGAGKSTLARGLAQELGFLYVDTGAIYRTVGLFVHQQGKDCTNPQDVIPLLEKIALRLAYGEDGVQHMYLMGEDVTEDIRQNQVSLFAAQVSAIPEVRDFLTDIQRNLAQEHSVVMDGRDIGTVVLPQADLKIFLTASAEKRALRRQQELEARGSVVSFQQVLEELRQRDEADRNRSVAPLRQAPDAVLLDTSGLTLEESRQVLRAIIKEKLRI